MREKKKHMYKQPNILHTETMIQGFPAILLRADQRNYFTYKYIDQNEKFLRMLSELIITVVYFNADEVPNKQKDPKNTSIVETGKEDNPGNHSSAIFTSTSANMIELLEVISRCLNDKMVIENRQHQFALGKSWLTIPCVFRN